MTELIISDYKYNWKIGGPICRGGNSIICEIFPSDLNNNKKTCDISFIVKISDTNKKSDDEINIYLSIKHSNISEIIDYKITNKKSYIVFKKHKYDLHDALIENNIEHFSEEDSLYYIKQLLETIKYLHNNNIYHCDLSLQNILLDHNENIILADFGLSSNKLIQSGMRGSKEYLIPDMFLKINYNSKDADLWACGIILYKLITNKYLFPNGIIIKNKSNSNSDQTSLSGEYNKFLRDKIDYIYNNTISDFSSQICYYLLCCENINNILNKLNNELNNEINNEINNLNVDYNTDSDNYVI
jgi:serine/threonine protein kinase